MADSYQLTTISDLLKIPLDRLDDFLEDLRLGIESAHFVAGEDIDTTTFDQFVWTDDGERTATVGLVEVREEVAEPAGSDRALREAVTVIYLTDNSDYLPALWTVVRALNPEIAELLERDPSAAFKAVHPDIEEDDND